MAQTSTQQILVPHPEFADTFFTDQEIVACTGSDLGHPRVFLEMADNKEIICPYCSRRFIYKH